MKSETIDREYKLCCDNPSDINEHLPTLKKYSDLCDHVTEMGVRSGRSTWAFLKSNCKFLISYDIRRTPAIDKMESMFMDDERFTFIECDVLDVDISNTELLFIDTLHTYEQLLMELTKHSKNVSKYIILHDTTSFGSVDERVYTHASKKLSGVESEKKGLNLAIEDFQKDNDGINWKLLEQFTNNNGLTILSRNN